MPEAKKAITIEAPNFQILTVEIVGTAPYMQLRFTEKAMNAMKEKMEAGTTSTSKKKRKARDFEEE